MLKQSIDIEEKIYLKGADKKNLPIEELRKVSKKIKNYCDEQIRIINIRNENVKDYEQIKSLKGKIPKKVYMEEIKNILSEPVPFAHYDGLHWDFVEALDNET
jgi:hypothetical protein